MKNQKKQLLTITTLCLSILLMGIYFASVSYSAALDATKSIGAAPSRWDVNIDELSYNETIGCIPASKHSTTATTSTSEVTLSNPNEFFEYTIKLDNDGNLDAVLRGINIEGISENQKQYLDYSVIYNEEKYTDRTRDLEIPLENSQSTNVVIRVEYKEIDQNVLPLIPQTFNLVVTFEYQQA